MCVCVCVHARARVVSAKSTLGSRQVLGKILADAQLSSWLMNEQASSVTVGIWDRSRVIRGKGDHARFTRSRFPILHDGCIVNGWIYRYPRFASEFSFLFIPERIGSFLRESFNARSRVTFARLSIFDLLCRQIFEYSSKRIIVTHYSCVTVFQCYNHT